MFLLCIRGLKFHVSLHAKVLLQFHHTWYACIRGRLLLYSLDSVIWLQPVKSSLLLSIYKIQYLSEKKLYINKHYHELNDTGASSCTLGLYAGNN